MLANFPGEFGVVYRAEYYQPNDEEEYETFTVAVKTLKGIIYTVS